MNTTSSKVVPTAVLVLSIIGVGLTEISMIWSMRYWIGCFVVIGALFTFQANSNDNDAHASRHVLHWLGACLALALVFLFLYTGRLDPSQAGLVTIVLLGLSVFSDGLRISFRYVLIGIYLFGTAAIMAYVETFIWWFLLLSFALIVFEIYWVRRSKLGSE